MTTTAESLGEICGVQVTGKTVVFVLLLILLIGVEYYLYTHNYGIIAMLGVLLIPP